MPWRPGRAPAPGPAPVLTSIDPPSRVVGPTADVTLRCLGSNFSPESYIVFAGLAERTDFVSPNEVTTIITGSMFLVADNFVGVQVVRPNGGVSAQQQFQFTSTTARNQAVPGTVYPADPDITAEDATNAAKLTGEGFVPAPANMTAWANGEAMFVGFYAFHWTGTAWAAGGAP